MRLLTTLGQDVDITVRAKPRDRAHGRIRVLGECGMREGSADAAQPRPEQDDERPRERPPGNLRGHAAAQRVDEAGEAVGRGGGCGGRHDSIKFGALRPAIVRVLF